MGAKCWLWISSLMDNFASVNAGQRGFWLSGKWKTGRNRKLVGRQRACATGKKSKKKKKAKWSQRRHKRAGKADNFTSASRVRDGQSLKGHGRHRIGWDTRTTNHLIGQTGLEWPAWNGEASQIRKRVVGADLQNTARGLEERGESRGKRQRWKEGRGERETRVYAWELRAWKVTGLSDPLIESRLCFPGKNTLVC